MASVTRHFNVQFNLNSEECQAFVQLFQLYYHRLQNFAVIRQCISLSYTLMIVLFLYHKAHRCCYQAGILRTSPTNYLTLVYIQPEMGKKKTNLLTDQKQPSMRPVAHANISKLNKGATIIFSNVIPFLALMACMKAWHKHLLSITANT